MGRFVLDNTRVPYEVFLRQQGKKRGTKMLIVQIECQRRSISESGKITEFRGLFDGLALMQQLGAIPDQK